MAKAKKLRITYTDGREVDATIIAADRIAAERHFKLPMSQLGSDEHAFFLAWKALSRSGEESRDFDAFSNVVADLGAPEEENADPIGEPDPPLDTSSS